jgi:hypothetical protein
VTFEWAPLDASSLYEFDWLKELFGQPAMWQIETISSKAAPPDDAPIVIYQRPHCAATAVALTRWAAAGAKFYLLHLSDEYTGVAEHEDPIDVYELEACLGVLRFYPREGLTLPKVLTIPLGYHHTVEENREGPLKKTPKLPFRETSWSFFGTNWHGQRERELKPLLDLPVPKRATFFAEWKDAANLNKETYVSSLLDSVFVPCPDGINGETFRFYEALECGCVPLVVTTPKNEAWLKWIQDNVLVLPFASWDVAAAFVLAAKKDPARLEAYRTKLLISWHVWKHALRVEVAKWFAGPGAAEPSQSSESSAAAAP